MTIAVCVAWYDEPLESLERCIRSTRLLADTIVTYDGRWEAFDDDGPVHSPDDQRALVRDLVAELYPTTGYVMETYSKPLKSQVDKRARLYRTGANVADWIFALDADEHLEHCDLDQLTATLATTDLLSGLAGMRTDHGPSARRGLHPTPRLFAGRHGLTVEHYHNGIRTTEPTPRWLAGDPAYITIEATLDLTSSIRFFHSQGVDRSRDREARDRLYRRKRLATKQERWPARAPRTTRHLA